MIDPSKGSPAEVSLQVRNEELGKKYRDSQIRVREFEDRIQVMAIERDKIISDYDAYIDKLLDEKERTKGLEGLVKKLETEKEFLENEVEKVRAIKMMLENQLNAYSDNAEIRRLKGENDKQLKEITRFKRAILEELGHQGDPSRTDINTVISSVKKQITISKSVTSGGAGGYGNDDQFKLRKRNEELEDQLRFTTNDFNGQIKQNNAEIVKLRNMVEALRKENALIQREKADAFQQDNENSRLLKVQFENIKKQHQSLIKEHENLKQTVTVGGAGGGPNGSGGSHTKEVIMMQERIRQLEGGNNGQLISEIANLRQELDLSINKINTLQQRNSNLEARHQEMSNRLFSEGTTDAQQLAEYRRLMNHNAQLEMRNQQLENEMNNTRRMHQQQNRDMDDMAYNQQTTYTNISNTNHNGANQGRGVMGMNIGQGGNYKGTGGNDQIELDTHTTNANYARANITSQHAPNSVNTTTVTTRRKTRIADGSPEDLTTENDQMAIGGQPVNKIQSQSRSQPANGGHAFGQDMSFRSQSIINDTNRQANDNDPRRSDAFNSTTTFIKKTTVVDNRVDDQGDRYQPDTGNNHNNTGNHQDDDSLARLLQSGNYNQNELSLARIWSGQTVGQADLEIARRINAGQCTDADIQLAASRSQGRVRPQDLYLVRRMQTSTVTIDDIDLARRVNDNQHTQADIQKMNLRSDGRVNSKNINQFIHEINTTTIHNIHRTDHNSQNVVRQLNVNNQQSNQGDAKKTTTPNNDNDEAMNIARLWSGPSPQQSDLDIARRISTGQCTDADIQLAASRSQGRVRPQDLYLVRTWRTSQVSQADIDLARRLNEGRYTDDDMQRANRISGGKFNENTLIDFRSQLNTDQRNNIHNDGQSSKNQWNDNGADNKVDANRARVQRNSGQQDIDHVPQWGHETHYERTGQILKGVGGTSSWFAGQPDPYNIDSQVSHVRRVLNQEPSKASNYSDNRLVNDTIHSTLSFNGDQLNQNRGVEGQYSSVNGGPSFGGTPTNQNHLGSASFSEVHNTDVQLGQDYSSSQNKNFANAPSPNIDQSATGMNKQSANNAKVSIESTGYPSGNADAGGVAQSQVGLPSARQSGMHSSMHSTSTIVHLEKIISQMSSQPNANPALIKELTNTVQSIREQEIPRDSMRVSQELNGDIVQSAERAKKMEILLQKKQREIDDLLMRIFLIAAENDRLRSDDQLARNIEKVNDNQTFKQGMEANERSPPANIHQNSAAYEAINRVLPSNDLSYPKQFTTITNTREPSFIDTYANFISRPSMHGNQVYHHEEDNQHLTAKLKRKTDDIDSIIKDIYDRHGITSNKHERYSTPDRVALMQRLGVPELRSKSRDANFAVDKSEIESYFNEVNPRVLSESAKKEIQQKLRVDDTPEKIRIQNSFVVDKQNEEQSFTPSKAAEPVKKFSTPTVDPKSTLHIQNDDKRVAQPEEHKPSVGPTQPTQLMPDPFRKLAPSPPNRINPNRIMFPSAGNLQTSQENIVKTEDTTK